MKKPTHFCVGLQSEYKRSSVGEMQVLNRALNFGLLLSWSACLIGCETGARYRVHDGRAKAVIDRPDSLVAVSVNTINSGAMVGVTVQAKSKPLTYVPGKVKLLSPDGVVHSFIWSDGSKRVKSRRLFVLYEPLVINPNEDFFIVYTFQSEGKAAKYDSFVFQDEGLTGEKFQIDFDRND